MEYVPLRYTYSIAYSTGNSSHDFLILFFYLFQFFNLQFIFGINKTFLVHLFKFLSCPIFASFPNLNNFSFFPESPLNIFDSLETSKWNQCTYIEHSLVPIVFKHTCLTEWFVSLTLSNKNRYSFTIEQPSASYQEGRGSIPSQNFLLPSQLDNTAPSY